MLYYHHSCIIIELLYCIYDFNYPISLYIFAPSSECFILISKSCSGTTIYLNPLRLHFIEHIGFSDVIMLIQLHFWYLGHTYEISSVSFCYDQRLQAEIGAGQLCERSPSCGKCEKHPSFVSCHCCSVKWVLFYLLSLESGPSAQSMLVISDGIW